ncbi:MAG: hypothetical protein D3920_01480 [Candidatus Electrothrix sp. AW2]|nr:hypothetical protein [Candidatus Electrothrix gigas]MCI5226067.1 hypothetical protein [Candidatus Electrothrix gigas]
MEIEKARKILWLLADGTNPITGEIFPDDSPYNHPTVIRALFTTLAHVKSKQNKLSIKDKQAQNIANTRPKNAGLPWTNELKQKLEEMFKKGTSISELASYFERTEGAISSQLVRQGLIDVTY